MSFLTLTIRVLGRVHEVRASTNFSQSLTQPPLTCYEITRLIAMRARQLEQGAVPNVASAKLDSTQAVIDAARRELVEGVLPLCVRRFVTPDELDPNREWVEIPSQCVVQSDIPIL